MSALAVPGAVPLQEPPYASNMLKRDCEPGRYLDCRGGMQGVKAEAHEPEGASVATDSGTVVSVAALCRRSAGIRIPRSGFWLWAMDGKHGKRAGVQHACRLAGMMSPNSMSSRSCVCRRGCVDAGVVSSAAARSDQT